MVVLVSAGTLIGPSVLGLVSNPLSGVGAQLLFNIQRVALILTQVRHACTTGEVTLSWYRLSARIMRYGSTTLKSAVGVALILFHGGTGISLRVISSTAVGLGLLVLPGVLLTALIVALVVSPVFGVAFPVALLVGAVLAATDPAILIPLFDRLKLRSKVSQTVIAESAFNEVTGTVLTLTLVGIVEAGKFTLSGPALEFTQELALGALIGVVAGAILCYAISSTARAGIWDESPGVAILAVVALAYFSTESLGGSAYLATFVMGLMVGNMEMLRLGHHDEHATLLEGFLGQVAEIATLLVFVTLGLNLPFDALGKYFFGGLLVMFVFIFVARPITVLACLLPDRRGEWTGREIAFISWCRETGVIPAAVASLLLARGSRARRSPCPWSPSLYVPHSSCKQRQQATSP